MAKGKNRKKIYAVVAVCAALAITAGVLTGMMPTRGEEIQEEPEAQKTVVETTKPVIGDVVVTGSYVATVEPDQQVTVYPKASGEVIAANFAVGDIVEAGEVLFSIDSSNLQLDIAQTRANIEVAEKNAQLGMDKAQTAMDNYEGRAEDGMDQTIVNAENAVKNAEAGVQSANASLRTARRNYSDARDEDADDATLDMYKDARVQAELGLEKAQLALEQAEEALEIAKRSTGETRQDVEYGIQGAEIGMDLTASRIGLQKLQKTLSDYTVTSPIRGIIEKKNIKVYDMTSPQAVAYVISNRDAITLSFKVPETALNSIRMGDEVVVEKNEQTCIGNITEIATMVDEGSGLYTIKALVTNAPFVLHSGSTVKLYADTQKVESQVMVPIDAVYYDDGDAFVYIYENGTAVRRDIVTGIADKENIQVKTGLFLSEEVIVTWSSNLFDGASVALNVPAEEVAPDSEDAADTDEESEGDADTAEQDEETTADAVTDETSTAGAEPAEGGDAAQESSEGEDVE